MALTSAQLAELAVELGADPEGLGYAASLTAGSHNVLASLLNAPRAEVTVRRADITSQELVEAILVTDFTALPGSPTAAQLSSERRYLAWLSGLFAVGQVRLQNDDGTDTPVIANLQAMFPAGSDTRTRLLALAVRQGSRAEELFGTRVSVSTEDVALALGG